MPRVSIVIPVYGMENGVNLFRRVLDSIKMQTFKDFEIIVTDNSQTSIFKTISESYPVTFYKNFERVGMAANLNFAISKAKGELIKVLFQDDYFTKEDSLQKIVDNFTSGWLVTACGHDPDPQVHIPYWNNSMIEGVNTIGSPSVLTFENKDPMEFDENMTWLLDCDYYQRLYERFGEPTILNDINVNIGLHNGQVTNLLSNTIKVREHEYMKEKYA